MFMVYHPWNHWADNATPSQNLHPGSRRWDVIAVRGIYEMYGSSGQQGSYFSLCSVENMAFWEQDAVQISVDAYITWQQAGFFFLISHIPSTSSTQKHCSGIGEQGSKLKRNHVLLISMEPKKIAWSPASQPVLLIQTHPYPKSVSARLVSVSLLELP